MKPNSGLESFVGRHHADLDAFEPRADLWDAIEARLDEPADEETPTHVLPLNPAPTAPYAGGTSSAMLMGWSRYAAAAAVALVLLAGGYGLQRADKQTAAANTTALTALGDQPTLVTEALSSTEPVAVAANSPARRLSSAVRRMEAYYASQILEKQHDLRQLDAEATPGTVPQAADWKQELVALDSTYRQLRAELYRNPDPDAVLQAMDQNLQIRLGILNQQLRTREQIRQYHDEAYLVANNK